MKILFYLPVVTPWWFEAIIAPMLRALHGGSTELHVMVAPSWRNTGLDGADLIQAADLDRIHWHIVDQGEPDLFRTDGAAVPDLLDRVAAIAPDVTLARSADFAIAHHFPGVVRFIMEAGAPPFAADPSWVILDERPFLQSNLPAGETALADICAEALAATSELVTRHAPQVARAALGLPADRKVLAVPLHYEHEENYFLAHAAYPTGVAMIEGLLASADDDTVLAVSDHPLNRLYVDRSALTACLARHAGRVVDCTAVPRATEVLVRCTEAMVVDLSKCWTLAAFHGQPILDIGGHLQADWLRNRFTRPDPAAARRWFGWHWGTRMIAPTDLTPDRLERILARRPSDGDVAGNLARVIARQTGGVQQAAAA